MFTMTVSTLIVGFLLVLVGEWSPANDDSASTDTHQVQAYTQTYTHLHHDTARWQHRCAAETHGGCDQEHETDDALVRKQTVLSAAPDVHVSRDWSKLWNGKVSVGRPLACRIWMYGTSLVITYTVCLLYDQQAHVLEHSNTLAELTSTRRQAC